LNGAPRGSHERQSDEVKQRIERLARLQIGPLQDREKQIAQPTEDLRDELVLDLSPLDSLTGFAKEKELLHQIEKLDWGNTDANKYIANVINNSPRATREGVRVAEKGGLSAGEVIQLSRLAFGRSSRLRFAESTRDNQFRDLLEILLRMIPGRAVKRYGEIALLDRWIGRCWTFPIHFARLTLTIVLKEAENRVTNGIRGRDGRERGGSHGQSRRTPSRETKTKEKGNQTNEQTGETSRSIQTGNSGTARANEYAPGEDALARSRSDGHRSLRAVRPGEMMSRPKKHILTTYTDGS